MVDKLTMIFDLSNMFMRSLHTLIYKGDGPGTFDSDEENAMLVRKMAMDISYILRTFNPERVIFASDSKRPWRKEIYESIEGMDYKGNRKKDNDKNWDKIFTSLKEFEEILENFGTIVTKIEHAEADDVAAMWKRRLCDKENIIFVTSDRDWLQLIEFNQSTKWFCACYNPIVNNKGRKVLSLTKEMQEWVFSPQENKCDIFFNNLSKCKNILETVSQKDSKISIDTVNPDNVLLSKILAGDAGDNVPSFMTYYKSGKLQRITELKAGKLCESLKVNNVQDLINVDASGDLKPAVEKIMNYPIDGFDTTERLKRQRSLVELNPDLFPKAIVGEFVWHANKYEEGGKISTANIRMQNILANTKYLDEEYERPKENSIFEDLKGIEKLFGIQRNF